MNLLLDTNTVLYLLGGRLADPLPEGRYLVSVITEMELLSYPSLKPGEEDQVRTFLSEVTVVELTREISEAAVRLRREHALKLPDAIIAATAVSLKATLLTNDNKLARIPDVSIRELALQTP